MMVIESLSLYINLIEKLIDLVEGKKRKKKALNTPLGETLKKVETAQEHLTDAIEAIDVIREQVISERTQLDTFLSEVEHKKVQYKEATSDLKDTQQLLNQDQEKLRTALGINSKREKIIGFISGIIASLIAALIWKFGGVLFEFLLTLGKTTA